MSVVVVVSVACALLAARPLFVHGSAQPAGLLVAMFVAVLAVGATWPLSRSSRDRRRVATGAVVAIGLATFVVGRVVAGGRPAIPFSLEVVAVNTLAAVAEEALFRRLVYGALVTRGGPAVAVAGSALLFAAVHVPIYGLWVLPLDIAAGLVLSWQRWAAGSWRLPAFTHVIANLLVVL